MLGSAQTAKGDFCTEKLPVSIDKTERWWEEKRRDRERMRLSQGHRAGRWHDLWRESAECACIFIHSRLELLDDPFWKLAARQDAVAFATVSLRRGSPRAGEGGPRVTGRLLSERIVLFLFLFFFFLLNHRV